MANRRYKNIIRLRNIPQDRWCDMGRTRKTPALRLKDGCLVMDVYRPDGKRTTISFGAARDRTTGEVYSAFGQWLDLYDRSPHRVLTFDSPYDATRQILNPAAIVSVGEFRDKYLTWMNRAIAKSGGRGVLSYFSPLMPWKPSASESAATARRR